MGARAEIKCSQGSTQSSRRRRVKRPTPKNRPGGSMFDKQESRCYRDLLASDPSPLRFWLHCSRVVAPVEWASIGPSSRRHVFCLDGGLPSTPGSRATWGGCVASCAATRGHSFGLRALGPRAVSVVVAA